MLTEAEFTLRNRFTIVMTRHFLLLQVSRLFQHQSIGAPVYFVVVKLVLLEKDPVRCFFFFSKFLVLCYVTTFCFNITEEVMGEHLEDNYHTFYIGRLRWSYFSSYLGDL